MGGDSLTHTNLYGQERQDASIQHGFHRVGGAAGNRMPVLLYRGLC
jgi:hypothetical protein